MSWLFTSVELGKLASSQSERLDQTGGFLQSAWSRADDVSKQRRTFPDNFETEHLISWRRSCRQVHYCGASQCTTKRQQPVSLRHLSAASFAASKTSECDDADARPPLGHLGE